VFGFILGLPLLGLTLVSRGGGSRRFAGRSSVTSPSTWPFSVIFAPVRPGRLGPVRLQGLFIRRQPQGY
jgi:hypothetical protein